MKEREIRSGLENKTIFLNSKPLGICFRSPPILPLILLSPPPFRSHTFEERRSFSGNFEKIFFLLLFSNFQEKLMRKNKRWGRGGGAFLRGLVVRFGGLFCGQCNLCFVYACGKVHLLVCFIAFPLPLLAFLLLPPFLLFLLLLPFHFSTIFRLLPHRPP